MKTLLVKSRKLVYAGAALALAVPAHAQFDGTELNTVQTVTDSYLGIGAAITVAVVLFVVGRRVLKKV
jgi:hypothetical protein